MTHTVYRCSPCDRDWPSSADYNLCPRCQRCTWVTEADERPDHHDAKRDATRFKTYRDFDAACDAGQLPHQLEFAAATAASLPADPPPTNYGLAGPPRGDKPHPFQTWDGDNA